MIGDWRVQSLPRCTHHVFLSHCAEDRVRLVQPVYNAYSNLLQDNLRFPLKKEKNLLRRVMCADPLPIP